MSSTHTRTHVRTSFANPYMACGHCGDWVTAWHDPEACRCGSEYWNLPGGHPAAVASVCPSWGPVDGCSCAEALGSVEHVIRDEVQL